MTLPMTSDVGGATTPCTGEIVVTIDNLVYVQYPDSSFLQPVAPDAKFIEMNPHFFEDIT